jgi:release factor glutamine methyltransferase
VGTADNLTEPPAGRLAASSLSIRQLLASGIAALRAVEPSSTLAAEVLLAHALDQPRSALIAHGERAVEALAIARYRSLIARHAAGEPLAYLTGEREFWSLPLTVTRAVLIPRPETELVVERALALLAESDSRRAQLRVADLGTGSGAIALAVASERPHWALTASDCSAGALEVARANAVRLGLARIEFLAGNWFEPLAGRRFDAILANPPYVAEEDEALGALRHEPAAALIAGPDGLEALRHLIAHAPEHLERGAWLVLEHGADQAGAVAAALVAAGYARVRCQRDLAGRERVTEAQW